MWWVGPLVQFIILVCFFIVIWWKGPKGRFARLRCAIRGYHLWKTDVKASTGQGEDEGVLILEVFHKCELCEELLHFGTKMDFHPIDESDADIPMPFEGGHPN